MNWRHRQFFGDTSDPIYKSGCGIILLMPFAIPSVLLVIVGLAWLGSKAVELVR